MDQWLVGAGWALAVLLFARLVIGLLARRSYSRRRNVKTMVVLGSGGHTAEMLSLLRGFDLHTYQPRCYVVAATDAMSGSKAAAFEAEASTAAAGSPAEGAADTQKQVQLRRSPRKAGQAAAALSTAAVDASPRKRAAGSVRQTAGHAAPAAAKQQQAQQEEAMHSISVIPRSREVGQPWLSSAVSTARALWASLAVVFRHRPDLVLVNGPGTCIPIVAAAWLARLLGFSRGRVVYVESIARVFHLSLSGKILYHSRLADEFFVQWEDLQTRYPRATYAGRLM